MKGLHLKLLRDLKTLRPQIFTIAILIVGGISVLVSSWSSYRSLERSKNTFYEQYHFAQIFAEVVRAPETLTRKLSQVEGVERVESRIIKEGLVEVGGQVEPALGRFVSWRGEHQGINLIYLREGRMPLPNTIPEVVVHESFAIAHKLKIGDGISALLGGQKRNLLISGIGISPESVYALSPIAPLPDDKHFGIFWMRQKDLEMWTGMDRAFNSLQFLISKDASMGDLKRQIDLILQPYGNAQSYDRSMQISHVFVEGEIREQRVMAMVIPVIFLAVAMFILNVTLSRMVSLHRTQIATLKSLGYSAWALTLHYFQLVTCILLIGIIPSIFAGFWIGHWYAGLYKEFFRLPHVDFSLSVPSIVLGFLAGLIPGWIGAAGALSKVFSMQPAEALRPPSPPQFQNGLFEKIGLTRRFNIFSKMIIRSLLFRPLRLFFSVLGIAGALAILINGSFWTDVMDFMMDRQFHEMRREDLSVKLTHPKGINVMTELQRIPGVLMTEGERNVPVRVQFRNMKKEISLLGWSEGAQLSRVLDMKGRVIEPRPGGLFLSRYFETEFGLKAGDFVGVKVLEGTQAEFKVPVLEFVDDIVGQKAYAHKNDLHRWLDEEKVVDTVHLKIDPRKSEQIYVSLKAKPEVAGITIRHLLLQSFNETVADMILTFTIILYAFAVAIAGAMMYNSARIGFSERSWELASLQILGFGTWATFELLLLDLGMQMLVALVPGLFFGYGLSYLSTRLIHNETFKFPLVIEASTYGAGVLVLLLTFFASGIFLF
ncbi:MAG: ABC transporter permease, partial [Pseudobdellovibrionaceae bacterium]